jgi:hypothetical protein
MTIFFQKKIMLNADENAKKNFLIFFLKPAK